MSKQNKQHEQTDEDEIIEIQDTRDFWFACVDIDVLKDNTLSPEARFIFSVMCTYASVMGERRYPNIEEVSRDSGFCIDLLNIVYRELNERGLLLKLWNRCDHDCDHDEDEE